MSSGLISSIIPFASRQFCARFVHTLFYATLAFMAGILCQFFGIPFHAQFLLALILIISGFIYKEYSRLWHPLFFLPTCISLVDLYCAINNYNHKNFQALWRVKPLIFKVLLRALSVFKIHDLGIGSLLFGDK